MVAVYTRAVYSCVGRVGLTAHPRRLRASPVSHVTMNARDMPSDLPLRKLAYIWGSSAEPQARMEARPSAKERRSRTPHAQSPNHVWVQRQPQSAGHSTRGETMAEKRTREEGRARASPTARANETDADSAAGKAAGVSRDLAGGAPCWAEIIHPSAGWSEEATHAERRTRV